MALYIDGSLFPTFLPDDGSEKGIFSIDAIVESILENGYYDSEIQV